MKKKDGWLRICFTCKDYKQGEVQGVCLLQAGCQKISAPPESKETRDMKSNWGRWKVEADRDEIKRWKKR